MAALQAGKFMNSIKINSKIKPFEVGFTKDFSFVHELKKIPNYMVVVGSVVYRILKTVCALTGYLSEMLRSKKLF